MPVRGSPGPGGGGGAYGAPAALRGGASGRPAPLPARRRCVTVPIGGRALIPGGGTDDPLRPVPPPVRTFDLAPPGGAVGNVQAPRPTRPSSRQGGVPKCLTRDSGYTSTPQRAARPLSSPVVRPDSSSPETMVFTAGRE